MNMEEYAEYIKALSQPRDDELKVIKTKRANSKKKKLIRKIFSTSKKH